MKWDRSDHMTDTSVTAAVALPSPGFSAVVLASPRRVVSAPLPQPLRRPGGAGGDTLRVALYPGAHPGVPPAGSYRQLFPVRGPVGRVEASSAL